MISFRKDELVFSYLLKIQDGIIVFIKTMHNKKLSKFYKIIQQNCV